VNNPISIWPQFSQESPEKEDCGFLFWIKNAVNNSICELSVTDAAPYAKKKKKIE